MIVQIGLRVARATAFAAAILIPYAALAIEDTTRMLAKNQRATETLRTLGDQLKAVLRPEIGFPEKYVVHWQAAVDAAFAPELLEADFLKAFETHLSDETRDAALAFDSSSIGQEAYELIMASQGVEGDAKYLAEVQKYLDTASVEENALHVDFFESQGGPKRANDIMDVYFRAMKTAAEPVIGAQTADKWIAGAGDLKVGYVKDYFVTTVATFRQLPQERLQELVKAVGTPEMVAYAEQSTAAFIEALNAAADRLETSYAKELGNN